MFMSRSNSQPISDSSFRVSRRPATVNSDSVLTKFECNESLRASTCEEIGGVWALKDLESLQTLLQREYDSSVDPNFLERQQPYISPLMRAILLDWLMEVSMEFTFKRETFHTALSVVDRLMNAVPAVQRKEFQLLGITALYIAAKLEEVCVPKIQDFARATDNGYSIEQIRGMERLVLKALKWRVLPATMNHWGSWLMSQWDDYLASSFSLEQASPYLFRQSTEVSYKLTREIYQLLDAMSLDHTTHRYRKPAVVASLLYLVLHSHFVKQRFSLFRESQPHDSHMMQIHNEYAFQELFGYFLYACLGIARVEDIFATCDFVRVFLTLQPKYDLPTVCRLQNREVLESHYEDFLAYQTHHIEGLAFIKSKLGKLID